MSAEPALLSAIRDRPDDDTPRLAYADWLDDAGDPARAEFVRVQVALARTPAHDPARPALEDREHALLAAHEPAWLGVPAEALTEWEWERGFVEELTCDPSVLLEHGSELFGRHPVRGWDVRGAWYGQPGTLLAAVRAWGDRIESLDATSAAVREAPDEAEHFIRDPSLGGLKKLDLGWPPWPGTIEERLDRTPRILARCEFRSTLESIRLGFSPDRRTERLDLRRMAVALHPAPLTSAEFYGLGLRAADLTEFLTRPCTRGLTRLNLSDTELGPDARAAFARPGPKLKALDLSVTPLAAFSLEPILSSPSLSELTELTIDGCGSAASVIPAITKSPFWRQAAALRISRGTIPVRLIEPLFATEGPPALRTLDLAANFLYDAGVADLCNASWAGSLTWLGLAGNYLTDAAAERIARSGRFRQLRTLHLSYNHPYSRDDADPFDGAITDRGAVALATSPGLATLRVLTLTGVSLTAAGVDALINGPFWRLSGLGLGGCELTPAAVRVLAASPRLARLSFLDLSRNRDLRGDALRPLAESPHLSPLLELEIHGCGASDGVREELRRRLGRRLGA